MALISLIEKIDHFFIHENLQSNIEENGRARILLYAMFITTFFATSYSLYYEFSNTSIHLVKRLANIIGFLTGPIGIILLKYRGNLKETFYGLLILVVVLVFTSTYFSGGIYSIDLLWMIIISVNCFLFVGIRGGLAMMFVAILYFIGFYGMNSLGWKDFKAENEALGVGYILYNHIFLLLLASIITYFFVNGAEKIKRELDEVKERRMKSLGYKYQYITHNANKIIALHRRDGSVSYISPAVKTILGFEEKEMLGVGY
ncbi:MAG: hypothetical protein K2Q22_11055, partial [Cytophagales bacterium]|nr:hypothetical protein [Cytophagales bacterium]